MNDLMRPDPQAKGTPWPAIAQADFDYYNLVGLLNNTQDLMWSVSTGQKMMAFNKAFAEMVKQISGYEVIKGGDAPVTGFDEERLKRWSELYIRAFSGEAFSIEEYTEKPVEYWSEVSFYPILQNGEVIGATCYSRNITGRKLSERALEQRNAELVAIKNRLEESQRSLSEAQEMAKVGSWSVDLATKKTYWSDELYKIFGVEKANVVPSFESYLSTIHKDDLERVTGLVTEGFKQLKGYSFYSRVIQADGSERYVYSDCRFTLGASGQPTNIHGIVHDITERTKSEAKLRYSESRLKQAQAVAHVGNWEVNFEKGYSIWSDESYRIYGIEPGDHNISFAKWMEFIHPEDIDSFREEMKRCEKACEDSSFYHRIIRPDKSIRFVISECRYELNNGVPIGLYGTVQDITEKVAMEEKVLQSHRLLEKLTDYIPAAVYQFEMDSEGKMTFPFMSKGFQSLFPQIEITGIKSDVSLLFDFVHPDDVKELISSIEKSRQQLTNWAMEFRAVTDAQERWFHGESKPEKKQNGTTVWYGYLQDITERKLTQEKIQAAKERYDMVAKATNDAIYDWNIQKGTVVRAGGLKDLFGSDQQDEWKERIHPEDVKGLLDDIARQIADPSVHNFEYEYRVRKNNNEYAYIYDKSFVMRNSQGKATRVIGAMQDISHRKQSEMLLQELNERLERRAEELVKSNTELEQFAYIASHDLQEPLRMVTSFLTQLEMKYGMQLDDKAKQYIHFATDGAARMRRIILDLLEYSRVGRQPDEKDTVDSTEVLFEAVQLNRAVIDEKKALIRWKELPVLKTNKLALQQVFQNLIGNALKYQESGRQPVIEISARETDTHWQFSFKDNGIGIEPRFFNKIFAVFQRLHNREEFSGTGIGLAICKKIVEGYGGQIWVESEPGAGSTFHCTFEKA